MALGLGITTELLEKPILLTPREQGLASNLQVWYENDNDITIETWRDQSGNGRHANQSNALLQPEIDNGGLRFDGANEYMDIKLDGGGSGAFSIGQSGPFSVFMAFDLQENANQVFLSDSTSEFIEIMTSKKFRFRGNDGGNLTSVLTFDNDVFLNQKTILMFGRGSDDVLKIYIDGQVVPYNLTSTNTTNDRGFDIANIAVRSDSDRHFTGTIYEMFMYNKYPEESEIDNLNEYLISKFSHL